MNIEYLSDGIVQITSSVEGNKIKDNFTGRKYSEVVCNEKNVKNFSEVFEQTDEPYFAKE